jgi:hypothetical protein
MDINICRLEEEKGVYNLGAFEKRELRRVGI